jgi:hypothetical protein
VIRALAALAALCALSACGVVGPSQSEVESAIATFYTRGEHPAAPQLQDATISNFESCQPVTGAFKCAVIFSTADGEVATLIWIRRAPEGGWDVLNIVRYERPS